MGTPTITEWRQFPSSFSIHSREIFELNQCDRGTREASMRLTGLLNKLCKWEDACVVLARYPDIPVLPALLDPAPSVCWDAHTEAGKVALAVLICRGDVHLHTLLWGLRRPGQWSSLAELFGFHSDADAIREQVALLPHIATHWKRLVAAWDPNLSDLDAAAHANYCHPDVWQRCVDYYVMLVLAAPIPTVLASMTVSYLIPERAVLAPVSLRRL